VSFGCGESIHPGLLYVLWQLFDKTAGDFPGVEIAASDLGLAPRPF
jgi:hypothetical protein